jgi:putative membrane protein
MFIDYITLMLINMAAGLVILAGFVYQGWDRPESKHWIPGFGITGAIALATGLHVVFTWPITGVFNIAYGETTVLFGILFLATAIALDRGWNLKAIAIYAFFAGVVAIVIGLRIANLGMTRQPLVSATGFVLTGLAGICAFPSLYLSRNRNWRLIGVVILSVAALIWAQTGYVAYWNHLETFNKWVPLPMR